MQRSRSSTSLQLVYTNDEVFARERHVEYGLDNEWATVHVGVHGNTKSDAEAYAQYHRHQ